MNKYYFSLLYTFYRVSLGQLAPKMAFICYITVFEILHLLLIGLVLKIFGISFEINGVMGFILMLLLMAINFVMFNEKFTGKMKLYYNGKPHGTRKMNLLFFAYMILLFILLYGAAIIHRKVQYTDYFRSSSAKSLTLRIKMTHRISNNFLDTPRSEEKMRRAMDKK